jgi:initiation factor 1A
MPKNRFGGNKAKKNKNRYINEEDIPLVIAKDNMMYGQVVKSLGEYKLMILCSDGIMRQGIIPGSMRRTEWMYVNDIVLVELRDCDSDKKKCDIIHKYSRNNMRKLQSMGLLKFINLY